MNTGLNWNILLPAVASFFALYLTYRGWSVNAQVSRKLEEQRHKNAINLEKQRAELKFTSDQIQYLYGPLMVLTKTYNAAYYSLTDLYGGKPVRAGFFDGSRLTSEELHQW